MNREKHRWFQTALKVQGSVIPAVMPRAIFCGIFGVIVSFLHLRGFAVSWPILGGIIPNIVLGLLLVFRTNTAYEKFWEGRKIWGTLVNTSRNFSRQIWVAIVEKTPESELEKVAALRLIVAFAFATKLHLRGETVNAEIEALVSPEQYQKLKTMNNPPLEIAFWIGDFLQKQHDQHCLNTYQLVAMLKLLDTMVDVLGSCERILKTPIPLAYSIHLKQLLLIYCLLLPFQMVNEVHGFTGPIVAFISFTLFGVEAIGIEIENPFGYDPNDLPLDTICATMLRNINDLISLAPNVHFATQTDSSVAEAKIFSSPLNLDHPNP